MNYETILNQKIQGIQPSGIRKFFDILEEMKDAISLGIGEPDFVTPWSGGTPNIPPTRAWRSCGGRSPAIWTAGSA